VRWRDAVAASDTAARATAVTGYTRDKIHFSVAWCFSHHMMNAASSFTTQKVKKNSTFEKCEGPELHVGGKIFSTVVISSKVF
jgi:hypothetical protein